MYTGTFFTKINSMGPLKRYLRGFGGRAKDDLVAYLSEISVHGFRYIVEGRNLIEKVAWFCIVLLGFIFSGWIIIQAFKNWAEYPVETTIDEVGLSVSQLPFPAITVCDTESLKMPPKNRWMFLETLLNSLELINPNEQLKYMYPGMIIVYL